jgi:hypothetical protein
MFDHMFNGAHKSLENTYFYYVIFSLFLCYRYKAVFDNKQNFTKNSNLQKGNFY